LALNSTASGAGRVTLGGKEATVSDAVNLVAEGQYSTVSEPFVAVVRDAGTYAALRGVLGELPKLSADFFKTNAIVAAFLGTGRTDESAVMVTRAAGGAVHIFEASRSGGASPPRVPTSPFRVVSVQKNDRTVLELELDEVGMKAMRWCRVSEGEFASRGGIAGRTETFQLKGDVGVDRLSTLITFAFDLESAGSARSLAAPAFEELDERDIGEPRRLRSVATGVTDSSGDFRVPQLEAGGLVSWPNGGLRAMGRLTDSSRLSLSFVPLPSNVSEAFEGRGKLEAVAVGR
jgi:hypothetical protein